MSVSNNLYYAILAMDAYNRINRGDDPQALAVLGTAIGNATLRTDDLQNLPNGYQNAGFFATAYDLNGEVVISFRGTDPTLVDLEALNDVFGGWIGAFGVSFAPQLTMAEEFLRNFSSPDVFQSASNVVLTGHSLGGGLAGYLSSLGGARAFTFDAMPFEEAAVLRWATENVGRGIVDIANISSLFDGTAIPFAAPPSGGAIQAFATKGEILEAFRLLAPAAVPGLLSLVYGPYALAIGAAADVVRGGENWTSFESHGGLRNPIDLHSQALLVSLTFAEEN